MIENFKKNIWNDCFHKLKTGSDKGHISNLGSSTAGICEVDH